MNTSLLAILGMGAQEIVILIILAALLFGAHKLPQLGRSMGGMFSSFRRAVREVEEPVEAALATPSRLTPRV